MRERAGVGGESLDYDAGVVPIKEKEGRRVE
jgi:hypothetical protein